MAFVDFIRREINLKISYYGPNIAGKCTSMMRVFEAAEPQTRGKLISLATEDERTIFFDFLLPEQKVYRGFSFRLHLYTFPGSVVSSASRRSVLRGADGIIFVADSLPIRREANAERHRELFLFLDELGLDAATIPLVYQYNKRDLPGALSIEQLDQDINPAGLQRFETVAATGQGVHDALRACVLKIIEDIEVRGLDRRRPGTQRLSHVLAGVDDAHLAILREALAAAE